MRLAQIAAPPLMASTNNRAEVRGGSMTPIAVRRRKRCRYAPASEEVATMSGGERINLGATVGVVGLLMGAGGALLAVSGAGWSPVGFVLLAFGIAGIGQGLAIVGGVMTPRGTEKGDDRDAPRD
jgi:hypothetical protein